MLYLTFKVGKHLLDKNYKSLFIKTIKNIIEKDNITNATLIFIISSSEIYKILFNSELSTNLLTSIEKKISLVTDEIEIFNIEKKKYILKDYVENIIPKINKIIHVESFILDNDYYYKNNDFNNK